VQHDALLFRDVILTPEQQYALTKAFDPQSEVGNTLSQGVNAMLTLNQVVRTWQQQNPRHQEIYFAP